MFDLIIRGGTVYDGTGAPGVIADVGVKDGVITAVGDLSQEQAARTVDAHGKAVTPGFIDMHSHGDLTLAFYPEMESKVRQGITTIVGGQCGLSVAPCDQWWESQYFERAQLAELSDSMFSVPTLVRADELSPLMERDFGHPIDWRSFGEFLTSVRKQGIGANYVPLVGHGTIRAQVLGPDFKRTATDSEIEQMKVYLHDAMKAGAAGMSSGLDYAPGIYCDFRELKAMCEVVAQHGGIYAPHWRKTGLREGTPKKQKKIEGIIESLELGLQTGVQVHLAHLSCGFDIFPNGDSYMAAASAKRTLAVIDEYRQKGVRVTHDVIPNITGGILLAPDLATSFLLWLKPCGSREQFAQNLRSSDYRASIAQTVYSGQYYAVNPQVDPDWARAYTILQHKNTDYVGRNLQELAAEMGREPLDMALDLLMEDPYTKTFQVVQGMVDASVREFIADPNGTIGSDTFAFDDKAVIPLGENMPVYLPNPNTYCGFVRYLCEFPQETFEATIRKVTGKPAEVLGLSVRGIVEVGRKADLLVIDRQNLRTNENHIDSRVWPDGIEYVFVNGQAAVWQNSPTSSRSGQVLGK